MSAESTQYRILLVEDDTELASMVADFLSQHEFYVAIETRGDTAVERIHKENPEAVVLDVNLPGLDGFEVCRAVRGRYHGAIIMLTARGEEDDEVLGLEVGADDYMAKPVRPRALLARLRNHLRSATTDDREVKSIVVGSLVVDATRRCAELAGVAVILTTAEFDLLYFLAKHAGRTVSRDNISRQMYGTKYNGVDRAIDLRVSRLRRKLGDDTENPQRIKSVRGVGYMLAFEP